ncbi:MAG: sialate O-acetylesterase [Clostridia bacterium]|nr:sialate O-acetylesterase [Clostridia bacterium]
MKTANIFQNNMVFSSHLPIRVFGEGDGFVTASLNGEKAETYAKGTFCVTLPPMSCGGPYTLTVSSGEETLTFSDIYVGEVLLCSGQSNMQVQVKDGDLQNEALPDNPLIRVYNCIDDPVWRLCSADTVQDFPDLPYRIAALRQKEKGCAVGVVVCAKGASVIKSWLPKPLADSPAFHLSSEEEFPDHYLEGREFNAHAHLYDTAFTPIVPFSFRAVIWYQGESDASPAEGKIYARELTALVNVFRKNLQNALLPFVIVQIASYPTDWVDYAREGWASIQAAQEEAATAIPRATLVTGADVCEPLIHPRNKGALAERIAEALG